MLGSKYSVARGVSGARFAMRGHSVIALAGQVNIFSIILTCLLAPWLVPG